MYKKLWVLFFAVIVQSAYADCRLTDDAGKAIYLKQPAQRIISLAPDLTEILFAVGAGAQIKAVIAGSDYPKASQKIPRVGSYSGIDLERILSLHPDLIVTWGKTFSRQLVFLEQLGVPVYISDPHQLEDVTHTLKNLGCLTGREKKAVQEADKFSEQLTRLQNQYASQKKISVFFQIGTYALMTINKTSWINEAITLCGGQNVFAEARTIAPEISWESLVFANPEVVLSDAASKDWKKQWLAWPEVRAVKNQHLFSINPDLIERASPRLLQGVFQICHYLEAARHRQNATP